MSRCFPFPPPGYEKEASTYDLDLLKKEKDKERKLKKEKKNREKKEGKDKEKKENDRSEGKHRDKKEKKDKHRDKKEKDRDKDKDKCTLDDNRLPKQVERISVDKASNEKKLQFPGRSEVNTGDLISQKGKERELDRNSLSGGKNTSRQFLGYGEKASQNSQFTEPPKDSKLLQQAERGIRDEVIGDGKQSVENFAGADARKDEGMVRLVAKSTGPFSDGMEKIKTSEDRKSNVQGVKNGLKFIGNVTSQSGPGIDNILKPLVKEGDKRIEGKERGKKKELDDRQGDKSKEKRDKEKDRNREKKKEEKAKQRSQLKKTESDKLKEIGKDGIVTGIYNAKTSQIPEESIKNPVTEGNPKKRKDLDTNGFLSGNDIKPSKVLKPSSSHPLTQNGKVSGTPSPVPLGRQGAVNKLQTDGKEHRINGLIESLASTVSSTSLPPSIPTKPMISTVKADPLTEPSRKLPHPDSKYLSVVLTVPKMEEWSDYDDQEWLFQGSDSQSKKPKVGTFEVDEIPQVWSEALRGRPPAHLSFEAEMIGYTVEHV